MIVTPACKWAISGAFGVQSCHLPGHPYYEHYGPRGIGPATSFTNIQFERFLRFARLWGGFTKTRKLFSIFFTISNFKRSAWVTTKKGAIVYVKVNTQRKSHENFQKRTR